MIKRIGCILVILAIGIAGVFGLCHRVGAESDRWYSPVSYNESYYEGIGAFDGFEWGNDGDALSTTHSGGINWTISVAGTSKAEIDTAQKYQGTRSARLYRDGTNNPGASFSQVPLISTQTLEFQFRKDDDGYLGCDHGNGSYFIYVLVASDEYIYYHDGSLHSTEVNVSINTWYALGVKNINWIAHTFDIYLNDSIIKTGATMFSSAAHSGQIDFHNIGTTSEVWLDNVIVSGDWVDAEYAYDQDFTTPASYEITGEWTTYIELIMDEPIYSTEIRVFVMNIDTGEAFPIQLDVYSGGEWVNVEAGDFKNVLMLPVIAIDFPHLYEIQYGDDELLIDKIRMRFYAPVNTILLFEAEVWGRYEENIGEQGPQGPAGINGTQGEQGIAGINGTQGEQGPQGEQGERGPRGDQGPQGEQGPEGPAGTGGTEAMPLWFILIWIAIGVLAYFSKSLVGNVIWILASILGIFLAFSSAELSIAVEASLTGLFVAVIGFAIIQITTKVERI